MTPNVKVRRNEKAQRYELVDDEQVIGVADYRDEGETVVFPHTEITSHLQGRGLGERLVRAALDDVRARGARVRAVCWFVRDFVRDNPEYAD